MQILHYIDRFSYKQILTIAVFLALLFAVPTTVWLVNQQTRLYSSAHRESLPGEIQNQYPQEPFGQPSVNPPKISAVVPFLGKVDDVVLVQGINFGQNPQDRAIYFGATRADEKDILRWHDDLIEVMVPTGASSGSVKVVQGDREDSFLMPFTVYSPSTLAKVNLVNNNLVLSGTFTVNRAAIMLKDGQKLETQVSPSDGVILFSSATPSQIASLALYDAQGNLVPFSINPLEFGF